MIREESGRGYPRILISPDKFKGTLTALEAAKAIRAGVLEAVPQAEVRLMPMADGGEGTVDSVLAVGGTAHAAHVRGPLGETVNAVWAQLDTTAVIEIAAASGLAHVVPNDETSRAAETYGTGELILQALDAGVHEIVLGLGGSASTDGGTGILRALGARFLDEHGDALPPGGGGLPRLARVDLDDLDPRLLTTRVRLCCDVSSPLLGAEGAAAVFGPQKGALPQTVAELDSGLERLARVLNEATGRNASELTWGGAAGGTAGGLYAAIDAEFTPGGDAVAELLGLDAHLRWADLLIVGEGSLDFQSLAGKAPVSAARRARRLGVPAAAIAGRVALSCEQLRREGIIAASGLADIAGSAEEAQSDAFAWARRAARIVASALSFASASESPDEAARSAGLPAPGNGDAGA